MVDADDLAALSDYSRLGWLLWPWHIALGTVSSTRTALQSEGLSSRGDFRSTRRHDFPLLG